jgi:hypothetical protein
VDKQIQKHLEKTAEKTIYRALLRAYNQFVKFGFGPEAAESLTMQAENRAREDFTK